MENKIDKFFLSALCFLKDYAKFMIHVGFFLMLILICSLLLRMIFIVLLS